MSSTATRTTPLPFVPRAVVGAEHALRGGMKGATRSLREESARFALDAERVGAFRLFITTIVLALTARSTPIADPTTHNSTVPPEIRLRSPSTSSMIASIPTTSTTSPSTSPALSSIPTTSTASPSTSSALSSISTSTASSATSSTLASIPTPTASSGIASTCCSFTPTTSTSTSTQTTCTPTVHAAGTDSATVHVDPVTRARL